MKNMKLQFEITIEDLKAIEGFYGKSDKKTVKMVIKHILNRYLNVEYFDPKLIIED